MNILLCTGHALTTKNDAAQNVSGAEVEKSCFRNWNTLPSVAASEIHHSLRQDHSSKKENGHSKKVKESRSFICTLRG